MILVDKEDEHFLKNGYYIHSIRGHTYIRIYSPVSKKQSYLHRLIMNASGSVQVDHINGDGTDNRRNNLRIATPSQNMANTGKHSHNKSGYKGVSKRKDRDKWRAQITKDRKVYWLGDFDNEVDAAIAYDVAASKHHGDFAYLNFA